MSATRQERMESFGRAVVAPGRARSCCPSTDAGTRRGRPGTWPSTSGRRRWRCPSRRTTWSRSSSLPGTSACGSRRRAPATTRRPLGALADTVLLKTERMRGVEIDPEDGSPGSRPASVWLEVVEAAAEHGLAAPRRLLARRRRRRLHARRRRELPRPQARPGVEQRHRDRARHRRRQPARAPTASTSPTCSGRCAAAAATSASSPRSSSGSSRSTQCTRASSGGPIERASEVLHAWGELVRGGLPDETDHGRAAPPAPADPARSRSRCAGSRSSSSRSIHARRPVRRPTS